MTFQEFDHAEALHKIEFSKDGNDFRIDNESLELNANPDFSPIKRNLRGKPKDHSELQNLTHFKINRSEIKWDHKLLLFDIADKNKISLIDLLTRLSIGPEGIFQGHKTPEIMTVKPNELYNAFRRFLWDCFFLQNWEMGRRAELRRPQRTDDPVSRLLHDYRNLALVLNEIKNRDENLIYEPLRRVVPNFERLTIDIIGGNAAINIIEKGLSGSTSAFRMSDGTLRFLTLLAAIHCQTKSRILVIEEPEIGLHPDALLCLAEILTEASKEMQIFLTTHSEVLVSAFSERLESVIVCENYQGQGTVMKHLDTEVLKIWLEKYTLGQIWRSGQIGGNP